MGYGSIANEAKPEGKGSHKNYCFSITPTSRQKKKTEKAITKLANASRKKIYLEILKTKEFRYSMTITHSPLVA